jgi:hypothetical protein
MCCISRTRRVTAVLTPDSSSSHAPTRSVEANGSTPALHREHLQGPVSHLPTFHCPSVRVHWAWEGWSNVGCWVHQGPDRGRHALGAGQGPATLHGVGARSIITVRHLRASGLAWLGDSVDTSRGQGYQDSGPPAQCCRWHLVTRSHQHVWMPVHPPSAAVDCWSWMVHGRAVPTGTAWWPEDGTATTHTGGDRRPSSTHGHRRSPAHEHTARAQTHTRTRCQQCATNTDTAHSSNGPRPSAAVQWWSARCVLLAHESERTWNVSAGGRMVLEHHE